MASRPVRGRDSGATEVRWGAESAWRENAQHCEAICYHPDGSLRHSPHRSFMHTLNILWSSCGIRAEKSAILCPYTGGSMQDSGYGLRRNSLPRSLVNKRRRKGQSPP
jgi:hypothetical protein